jgi:hypothetical protein
VIRPTLSFGDSQATFPGSDALTPAGGSIPLCRSLEWKIKVDVEAIPHGLPHSCPARRAEIVLVAEPTELAACSLVRGVMLGGASTRLGLGEGRHSAHYLTALAEPMAYWHRVEADAVGVVAHVAAVAEQ